MRTKQIALALAFIASFITGLSHFCSAQKKSKGTTVEHPNILFFLVDDMGWEDSSVPFWDSVVAQNKKFYTPNMMKLAAKAEKFTNAYANPICTPSRVSLMTGMNAAHSRVTTWTMFKNEMVDGKDSILMPPEWNMNGLSPVRGISHTVYATSLFQVLKDHGYFTIHCGKAHFGAYQTPGANPTNLGADVNIAGSAAGNPASYLGESDYGNVPGKFNLRAVKGLKEYWHTPTFLTKALTLQAMKAMDTAQMKHKPFFLYMAHYAVHLPYNADKRFIQKYLDEGYTEPEAAYCALVQGMDVSLGTLMNYLREHHLTKNTIVIFMSDNGGYSHPPREGKPNSQNYPLRGGKGSLYEGGIREPMMIYWPGVTKPGSVCSQYVDIQDFFPTVLQMAGIRHYKTVQPVDGKSMVPYILNPDKQDNRRILVWNYPDAWVNYDADGTDNSFVCAIRQGDWKLLYWEKYGRLELYNLRNDIKEQRDLAKAYPEKTKKLAILLTRRLKEYHAQRPLYIATGKPVPWPDEIK